MASRIWLIPADICCSQALGIKAEDLRGWRPIVANVFLAPLQNQIEQAESDRFGRFGVVHLFGAPVFGWACRALMHTVHAGVLRQYNYRFAFESYHPLEGGHRLYQGAAETGLPRGAAAA